MYTLPHYISLAVLLSTGFAAHPGGELLQHYLLLMEAVWLLLQSSTRVKHEKCNEM